MDISYLPTYCFAALTMAGEDSYYSLDGTISLTCTYAGVDEGTVAWYFGTTLLADVADDKFTITDGTFENNAQEFTLVVDDVDPENHAGAYSCKLTFTDTDTITDSTTVVIRKASVINNAGEVQSSIVVNSGELSAKCMLEADAVPSDVKWYKDSTEIDFTDDVDNIVNTNTKQLDSSFQYFSNITIKNFVAADEGTYKCEFLYSDSNNAETTTSVVFAEVEPASDCVFVDILTSDEATLTCTYTGNAEASSVAFTLPDESTVAGTLGAFDTSQEGTKVFAGLSSASDGAYTCTFTLSGGETVSAVSRLTARSKN